MPTINPPWTKNAMPVTANGRRSSRAWLLPATTTVASALVIVLTVVAQ